VDAGCRFESIGASPRSWRALFARVGERNGSRHASSLRAPGLASWARVEPQSNGCRHATCWNLGVASPDIRGHQNRRPTQVGGMVGKSVRL